MNRFDIIADRKKQEIHENFVQQASEMLLSVRTEEERLSAWKQIYKLLDEAMEEYKQYIFIKRS